MKKRGARGDKGAVAVSQSMQRARIAYTRGEWPEAERWCQQVLEVRGDCPDALNLLGVIAAQMGRAEEAACLLGRAVTADPGNATAHNNYGNVLQELKRFGDALGSYERALTLNPDYAGAYNNRGIVLRELGRFDDALASYECALTLKRDYAEAHNNRGNTLRELGRFDDALGSYAHALRLKPDYADAYNNRGIALYALRRFDDALASYERALTLKPDYAEAYNNRGNALRELRRFDDAIDSYAHALRLKPDFAVAYNNRGLALHELERFDDALEDYERALTLKRDYAEAYNNRASTFLELERFEEALNSLNKAVDCDHRFSSAYERLGALLNGMGHTGLAAAIYVRWLEVDPTNPTAQHLYAAASGRNLPERCDARHVTSLFDDFASTFDETLEILDYAAPQLLRAALGPVVELRQGMLDVLDAGCGTGLCGPLLRSIARFLAGVDLSSEMLAKAKLRNVYDELVQGELGAFMESRPQRFDIVNCADTLNYFGTLEQVMAAARRCLRPGGSFAFTVEALPEGISNSFMLTMTGRYAHSCSYVREAMALAGFSGTEFRSVELRKEAGANVRGYLCIGSVGA
jgi:predicted TPR repeat methyltransferase